MAQQLGLPSGRLSEILNGRRRLSRPLAEKISEALAYPPKKRAKFLDLVDSQNGGWIETTEKPGYLQLSTDAFHVLADWYHFAILSLIETDDFNPAPAAIAQRLGISPTQARSSLDRLIRLGLIRVLTDGTILKTSANISTTHDVESAALRFSHKQNLELAIASLEDHAINERDITSMTMAVDSEKLPIAKAMIKKFRRDVCTFLEGGVKNEVYNLNVQLIPLTKRKNTK
jgi:uncharacterized protein (TIGR02147 family)